MIKEAFAIGDIHGRYDCLQLALSEIERWSRPALVIFLGDYIDRGRASKQVLDRLIAGPTRPGDTWVCLKGNHEDLMCNADKSSYDSHLWLINGGYVTLKYFGAETIVKPFVRGGGMVTTLHQHYLDWCNALPLFYETDHHFFVHAGVSPHRKLCEQSPVDLLWIRDDFLMHSDPFEKHIVHGHSPQRGKAELLQHRTNLDSGAFLTNVLSIGRFDLSKPGPALEVIYVKAGGDHAWERN